MRPSIVLTVLLASALLLSLSLSVAQQAIPVASVSFELRSGYVLFPASRDGGRPLTFLFDTGCQSTAVRQEVLQGRPEGSVLDLFVGGHELKLENYKIDPHTSLSERLGITLDGVIGNDLLHNYTVTLDFERALLLLHDNTEFLTSAGGLDIPIDVNPLVSSLPLDLSFSSGQEISGSFVIDTGAPISVLLNSPIAKEHGLGSPPDSERDQQFKTKAALQTAFESKAETIRIGELELSEVPIYISTSETGLFAVTRYAGLVGTGVFRNYRVILDYKRKRLHLEPIPRS